MRVYMCMNVCTYVYFHVYELTKQKAQGDAAHWPAPLAAVASSHASDYDVDRDVDYMPSHHRAASSVTSSDVPRRGFFEPVQFQDLETDYQRNAKEYERCAG
jgi:hypothetical protein